MKTTLLFALLCLATTTLFSQATLVKDINPGAGDGILTLAPSPFPFQGNLFMSADDGIHGPELWISNGTEAGTYMVKDINPGAQGSYPYQFTIHEGNLYFVAYTNSDGYELWKTDGTEAGTQLHFSFGPGDIGTNGAFMASVNHHLIVKATTGTNTTGKLWSGDANGLNFTALADIDIDIEPEIAASDSIVFFIDPLNNLWKTDGTHEGTFGFFDFDNFFVVFHPMKVINNKLYFGYGGSFTDTEPWVSDGTYLGTYVLHEFLPYLYDGGVPAFFTEYNNKVYFNTLLDGMWRTDGTNAGTEAFKNIQSFGGMDGNNRFGLVFNGKMYFAGDDITNGFELWSTDGTSAGTTMLKDINNVMFESSKPLMLTDGNDGHFYFSALTSPYDYALWRSDGTTEGTVQIADPDPYPTHYDEFIRAIVPMDENLYFVTNSPNKGNELWKFPLNSVGTDDVFANLASNVKPNPATDKLFLTCNFSGDFEVQLLDLHGRTLQNWQRNAVEGQTLELNLHTHPNGLYLLQLNHEGNVQVLKTVIQN